MEGLHEFLETVRKNQLVHGHFRALLHIIIGRKIHREDGTLVSAGIAWRPLADLLREVRWDKDLVREFGLNPDDLPPRDRQRYWYAAILAAGVDTMQARIEADEYARLLERHGYKIGSAPGTIE